MTVEQATVELENLLSDNPEGDLARSFLVAYRTYCHQLDDIIDEHLDNPETLLAPHMLALNLYSSDFYVKYRHILYPVVRLIHHTYLDSVSMEHSGIEWQQKQALVLKNCGLEMTLAIIEILGGYDKRRALSIAVRESTWFKHETN